MDILTFCAIFKFSFGVLSNISDSCFSLSDHELMDEVLAFSDDLFFILLDLAFAAVEVFHRHAHYRF
jgi:hypothetical protein